MTHPEQSPARARPLALLVLGMHRSGTSAATGLLDRLGIPAAGELLPAESYNEKGIYENKAINLFHNRLLAHLGSAWDDPMSVSTAFLETAAGQGFVQELAYIIKTELFGAGPAFAVKDPRMCRFIPLWKASLAELDASPRAVIPLRHPLEVAESLASRDRFPRAKSFLLWLDHSLAAERNTRDLSRSFFAYDRLLSDWRGISEKLSRDLDLSWPKERGRVENAIDEFLSRDLRNHTSSAEIGEATRLDDLVARSWVALSALIDNAGDEAAQQTLDAVRDELSAATSVVSPYVSWEFSSLAQARRDVDRLEHLEGALRRDREEIEIELRRALQDEHDQHVQELRKTHAIHAAQIHKLDAALRTELQDARDEHNRSTESAEAAHRQLLIDFHRTEQRAAGLDAERSELGRELHRYQAELNAVRSSTSWRVTSPLRSAMGSLSPATKDSLRRMAKAGWWAATPWKTSARLRFLRKRNSQTALAPAAENEPLHLPQEAGVVPAPAKPLRAARRGSSFQPALATFQVDGGKPRLSMVTDSINAGSLFGGVATALIFSALLAKRTNRSLRIVTRTQAPAAENVATVFRAHGIEWVDNIEFAFADIDDEKSQIDVHPDELFVTTSWWTTHSTRQSVADDQVLYILQEDERMFYPVGDDYLACSETIGDRRIRRVINSQLLHEHFKQAGIVGDETPFFEPSFPKRIYFPEPASQAEKRNFFFYARPNNVRNLYSRGVEVVEAAIERGILDPQIWNIHFVGKDLVPMKLAGGIEPIVLQNMPWEEYAAYVRSVDLALTLMYTPHPSYPPLDVAACGGVALTNSFGVKTDLSRYSSSIICVDSELDSLVKGLEQGVRLALDQDGRNKAFYDSHIKRDWTESFASVFDHLGDSLVR